MINRAELRACGHSRGSRRLDSEPATERTAGSASNEAEEGFGRRRREEAGFQPYWGKPAVRNEPRGWSNRGHDLMAICHGARKSRYSGSHWSKPARLALLDQFEMKITITILPTCLTFFLPGNRTAA